MIGESDDVIPSCRHSKVTFYCNCLFEGLLDGYRGKSRQKVCSSGLQRHPPLMEGEVSCNFISYRQWTGERARNVTFHNALRILIRWIEYWFTSYSSSVYFTCQCVTSKEKTFKPKVNSTIGNYCYFSFSQFATCSVRATPTMPYWSSFRVIVASFQHCSNIWKVMACLRAMKAVCTCSYCLVSLRRGGYRIFFLRGGAPLKNGVTDLWPDVNRI